MEKKTKKEKGGKLNTDLPKESENISTLRDILFGKKIAEFEKRFEDQGQHLDHEITGIRDETVRLYNSLENFVKDEQKAQSERFKEEQEERLVSDKRIREDIDALSDKLTAFKEESATTHRELRQLILDQNKKLSEELQQLKRELNTALEAKSTTLDDKKVSRLALADLLTEMASQLGGESATGPADPRRE